MKPSHLDLSVIIVTHGRAGLLKRCLESLFKARALCSKLNCEIIVGVNGQDPLSLKTIGESKAENSFEVVEFQDPATPAARRNELVEKSCGQWVYFIDDDARVDASFFKLFMKYRESYPQYDVLGGPNLTPLDSSIFQRAAGLVLASRFAAYLSASRYRGTGKPRSSGENELILCNLFVRRSALGPSPFLPDLLCCEENWLLQSIFKEGGAMLYAPDLHVWHERREGFKNFARQTFKYGFGRGQNLRLRPETFQWPHVAPTLCMAYALLYFGSSPLSGGFSRLGAFPFFAYGLLGLVATLRSQRRLQEGWLVGALGLAIFPVLHASYGLGVAAGFLRAPKALDRQDFHARLTP